MELDTPKVRALQQLPSGCLELLDHSTSPWATTSSSGLHHSLPTMAAAAAAAAAARLHHHSAAAAGRFATMNPPADGSFRTVPVGHGVQSVEPFRSTAALGGMFLAPVSGAMTNSGLALQCSLQQQQQDSAAAFSAMESLQCLMATQQEQQQQLEGLSLQGRASGGIGAAMRLSQSCSTTSNMGPPNAPFAGRFVEHAHAACSVADHSRLMQAAAAPAHLGSGPKVQTVLQLLPASQQQQQEHEEGRVFASCQEEDRSPHTGPRGGCLGGAGGAFAAPTSKAILPPMHEIERMI